MATISVVETGMFATVQDLGRPGHLADGVSASGAADRGALRLGNRLLGQPETTAGIECTMGGLQLRPDSTVEAALTGAPCPAWLDRQPLGWNALITIPAGTVLRLGLPINGLRSYCAIRGGIDVPPVLGSRATDTLSGLGPPVLRAGDTLPVGNTPDTFPILDQVPEQWRTGPYLVVPGPRADWFTHPEALTATTWQMSQDSDRIALRLTGESLQRNTSHQGRELPSEAMIRGAIQVPPDGNPVVFLSDHPVTGGYPVIGVVTADDVDRLAQAVPGAQITFSTRGDRVSGSRPPGSWPHAGSDGSPNRATAQ